MADTTRPIPPETAAVFPESKKQSFDAVINAKSEDRWKVLQVEEDTRKSAGTDSPPPHLNEVLIGRLNIYVTFSVLYWIILDNLVELLMSFLAFLKHSD